jgi:hypothetical protein
LLLSLELGCCHVEAARCVCGCGCGAQVSVLCALSTWSALPPPGASAVLRRAALRLLPGMAQRELLLAASALAQLCGLPPQPTQQPRADAQPTGRRGQESRGRVQQDRSQQPGGRHALGARGGARQQGPPPPSTNHSSVSTSAQLLFVELESGSGEPRGQRAGAGPGGLGAAPGAAESSVARAVAVQGQGQPSRALQADVAAELLARSAQVCV